jgi:hypothetical protein
VLFELRLYRSLLRWVARRPAIPGGDVEVFTYAKTVTPVIWLWIFASAAELPLAHVLVPWEAVRIALLVVGAWGLVWMVGLLASLHVYPHLLGRSSLRVRHGSTVDLAIPWEAIDSLTVARRDLPSTVWTLQPRETERGTDLQVAVSGQVNVHAVLRRPTTFATHKGDLEVAEVSFWADEPRALVRAARERLSPAGESGR